MKYSSISPGYDISKVISGNWQLSGGHGKVDPVTALENLYSLAELGITTYDCADIYTGVEEILGTFTDGYEKKYGKSEREKLRVHTKFVPDLPKLPSLKHADVEKSIHRSLKRLGAESLDLVQLHWWDFAVEGYVEAALSLARLQNQGLIKNIGLTNFDSTHMIDIISAGVPVVSNQVQFSMLDRRPLSGLTKAASDHGVTLLCYGAIAGGFLTDKWLDKPAKESSDRSEIKYKLIIDEYGGWDQYQKLLGALNDIALELNTSVSGVALAWVLGQRNVGGVICSMRSIKHAQDNLHSLNIHLSQAHIDKLDRIISSSPWQAGEVYDLERDRGGRHGSIMNYNLSDS